MQEANWSWDISSNMKLGINTRGKDVVIFSNEKIEDIVIEHTDTVFKPSVDLTSLNNRK